MNNHDSLLSLTGLEIFFIATTIISLVFNILQWKERRSLREPLKNTLIGLFNDIKQKSARVAFVYNALFNTNNPHKTIDTMRWECGLVLQDIGGYFQGFQETLVGALATLNPNDTEGKQVFRASDYGLTEEEKEYRRQYLERSQSQAPPHPPKNDADNGTVTE